jgi:cell division protein FtsL
MLAILLVVIILFVFMVNKIMIMSKEISILQQKVEELKNNINKKASSYDN